MGKIIRMTDLDLKGKRVMIREDLNVPIENGKIASEQRITASMEAIRFASEHGAKTILISHLGQPKEGEYDLQFSLKIVADRISEILGKKVRFMENWLDGGFSVENGEVVLCENVRFNKGEKKNDDELAKKMAKLCDIYVNDAFATAHRAQASTHAIAKYAPISCAGPLLMAELDALDKALADPQRPLVAIVGGSKVSTKVGVLESLIKIVDKLIVGGGIANTFLLAYGHKIGKSLHEADFVEQANELLNYAKNNGKEIIVPVDVIVAKELSDNAIGTKKSISEIDDSDMILDVGEKTSNLFDKVLKSSKTVVWNGPVGVFENDNFANGTRRLTESVVASNVFCIAGGGDTISALEKFNSKEKISYVSTGGGAFLEFLQGDKLPAVAILEEMGQK